MCKLDAKKIAQLKVLVRAVAAKYGVKTIYLFGSQARNEATADSDFDFYIDKGKIRNLFQLAGLKMELQDALHTSVDIVINGVKDKNLLAEIERDKVLLFRMG